MCLIFVFKIDMNNSLNKFLLTTATSNGNGYVCAVLFVACWNFISLIEQSFGWFAFNIFLALKKKYIIRYFLEELKKTEYRFYTTC